jgi:hypothetical protein
LSDARQRRVCHGESAAAALEKPRDDAGAYDKQWQAEIAKSQRRLQRGRKWYSGVQIGMGGSTAPISGNSNDTNAPGGTPSSFS